MSDLRKMGEDLGELVSKQCRMIADAYAPRIENAMRHRQDDLAQTLYAQMLQDMNRVMKPLSDFHTIYGAPPIIRVGELTEQDKAERRSPPISIWFGTAGEA